MNTPELIAEFKTRRLNALSHIRGLLGDENFTELGFPSSLSAWSNPHVPSTSLAHFVKANSTFTPTNRIPNSSSASSTTFPISTAGNPHTSAHIRAVRTMSEDGSHYPIQIQLVEVPAPNSDNVTRVNTPYGTPPAYVQEAPSESELNDSDQENHPPLPIPPRDPAVLPTVAAVRQALGLKPEEDGSTHHLSAILHILNDVTNPLRTHPPLATAHGEPIVLRDRSGGRPGETPHLITNFPPSEARVPLQPRATPPPPIGFRENSGHDYVPFQIADVHGRLWPARWTQVVMADDPYVMGFQIGDDSLYRDRVFAEPDYDVASRPTYAQEDLIMFRVGFEGACHVDAAVHHIGDLSLKVELHRWRSMGRAIAEHQIALKKLEDRIFEAGQIRQASQRRLEMANAMEQIEKQMNESVEHDVAAFVACGRGRPT
jgi:hypothetical protein